MLGRRGRGSDHLWSRKASSPPMNWKNNIGFGISVLYIFGLLFLMHSGDYNAQCFGKQGGLECEDL